MSSPIDDLIFHDILIDGIIKKSNVYSKYYKKS